MAIIPDYPVPPLVNTGHAPASLDLRLLFIQTDRSVVDQTIEQLSDCGRNLGLGEDRIRFDVERFATATPSLSLTQLGEAWDRITSLPESATIPAIQLHAITPTLLKRDGKLLSQPHVFDFVAASLRLLRSLLPPDQHGQERLSGSELDRLKHLASGVPGGPTQFRSAAMLRHSNRTGDRYRNDGICGFGEYHNVPTVLAEIINLAGPLGIGQQRVCGSGQVRCYCTPSRQRIYPPTEYTHWFSWTRPLL